MFAATTLFCMALLAVVNGFQCISSQKVSRIASPRDFSAQRNTRPLHSSADRESEPKDGGIDLSSDNRLYRVRLPREPGIEWGTDMNFAFVFVRDVESAGPASMSEMVSKGDQLCELTPVEPDGKPIDLRGASFETIIGAFIGLGKTVTDVDLIFFKGSKNELKETLKAEDGGAKNNINPVAVVEDAIAEDEPVMPSANKEPEPKDDRIDLSLDDRLYRIRLPRAPGLEWGTDLSFSFVYVREVEPVGPAALSGMVSKGDQLCELIPVEPEGKPINLLGAAFDTVMSAFAGLGKSVKEVDLVFFKGSKDELKTACTGEDRGANNDIITVTVIQNKGADDEAVIKIQAEAGVNIRQLLVDNGINVYQSMTRFTNCKGKQLCGTCIINVTEGVESTNWKSMDETSTLRDNPDTYRLSCVSFAYGDVTVETFPPIEKYQWTR